MINIGINYQYLDLESSEHVQNVHDRRLILFRPTQDPRSSNMKFEANIKEEKILEILEEGCENQISNWGTGNKISN